MSAKEKKESEEKALNEFFALAGFFIGNLNVIYESVIEYTDKYNKYSGRPLPDFYLRSKKSCLPDLAIEVKTLERYYDRITSDEPLTGIQDYELNINGFHIVIKLIPPGLVNPLQKRLGNFGMSLRKILRISKKN
jgi:hypothetical protein